MASGLVCDRGLAALFAKWPYMLRVQVTVNLGTKHVERLRIRVCKTTSRTIFEWKSREHSL